jgi:hypothetical protein
MSDVHGQCVCGSSLGVPKESPASDTGPPRRIVILAEGLSLPGPLTIAVHVPQK